MDSIFDQLQLFNLNKQIVNFLDSDKDICNSVYPVWSNPVNISSYLVKLFDISTDVYKISRVIESKILYNNKYEMTTYYKLQANGIGYSIDNLLLHKLYEKVSIISYNNLELTNLLYELKLPSHEMYERIEEFEVIKNGKIDLISLDSLFDFYKVPIKQNRFLVSLSE